MGLKVDFDLIRKPYLSSVVFQVEPSRDLLFLFPTVNVSSCGENVGPPNDQNEDARSEHYG
jgi:hypothetical protein